MDYKELAQEVGREVTSQSDLLRNIVAAESTEPGFAAWYGKALSEIVLLANGEGVTLADVRVESEDLAAGYTAKLSVFTESLVILVKAEHGEAFDRHTTRALSRSRLASLEVSTGLSAFRDPWPESWPGSVSVRLDYGDDVVVDLPAATPAPRAQHAKVAALLPSLTKDLTE